MHHVQTQVLKILSIAVGMIKLFNAFVILVHQLMNQFVKLVLLSMLRTINLLIL